MAGFVLLLKARANRARALQTLGHRNAPKRPVLTLLRRPDDIVEPLFTKFDKMRVA